MIFLGRRGWSKESNLSVSSKTSKLCFCYIGFNSTCSWFNEREALKIRHQAMSWGDFFWMVLEFKELNWSCINGCSRMGGKNAPAPKISHTYPTMMILGTVTPYLNKIQKTYKWYETPPDFCWHRRFHGKSAIIVVLRNTDIDCILIQYKNYNSYNFFWALEVILIKMTAILMTSVNLATLALF